ncbi:hypothetical protein DFH09DRAFT_1103873 [Mycena vulgaris]|nr:hypothetical protein DFH09DRAFT_1103873 [Mycena vulgaris]
MTARQLRAREGDGAGCAWAMGARCGPGRKRGARAPRDTGIKQWEICGRGGGRRWPYTDAPGHPATPAEDLPGAFAAQGRARCERAVHARDRGRLHARHWHGAWNMFGPGWGDPDTLGELDWTWLVMLPLNAISAAMAQGFYSWRIWSLTNRRLWLPISIGGITIGVRSVSRLFALWPEITVWFSGSATCDLLITASLVYILTCHKGTSQYQHTTGLINKLIRFSVSRPWLKAPCGLAVENGISTTFCKRRFWPPKIRFFILGRLYSNMLMATLNGLAPILQEPEIERGQSMNLNLITRTGVNGSRTTDGTTVHDTIVMSMEAFAGYVLDKYLPGLH